MSELILSIEDHSYVIPDNYSVKDSASYMAVVIGWAYERGSLCEKLQKSEDIASYYEKLKGGSITVLEFVQHCFDGEIYEETFSSNIREFASDYITTGVFYRQICRFFEVDLVYEISPEWSKCSRFMSKIEEHYQSIKQNY